MSSCNVHDDVHTSIAQRNQMQVVGILQHILQLCQKVQDYNNWADCNKVVSKENRPSV